MFPVTLTVCSGDKEMFESQIVHLFESLDVDLLAVVGGLFEVDVDGGIGLCKVGIVAFNNGIAVPFTVIVAWDPFEGNVGGVGIGGGAGQPRSAKGAFPGTT